MAKYTLLVLTNSVEGRDAEFNDWYTNTHLGEVLDVPGMVAAQRFKAVGPPPFEGGTSWQYFASYEMETDDPMAVLEELKRRSGTDRLQSSDALHSVYARTYEPITPRILAKGGDAAGR